MPTPRAAARSGTLVLLVRHGLTPTTGKVLPGRAPGLHLSEKGRAQAEAVAQSVARLAAASPRRTLSAVYASPLERARETARPIARDLGLQVRGERGLTECDVGTWTGSELASLRRLRAWRSLTGSPSLFRFPGGESFSEMQARALEAVAAIRARHPAGVVVAVSHADVIKVLLAAALGSPLDLIHRIVVGPCSVSAVHYADTGAHVLCVNRTGSLEELALS